NLENKEKIVFTKEDRIPIYDTPKGVKEELLLTMSEPENIEPSLVVLQPGCSTDIEKPHEGVELGYVIEGEIELYLNKEVYLVRKEETFFYSANKKHFIKNKSNSKTATLIWIEIF
ncbi:cupin domain-containing protein, partial [Petrotoga halophila]